MEIKYFYNEPIDSKLILETFKAAFGVEMDYSVFEWRFLKNPVNSKVYINYIIIDGILAAYYAVSPVMINVNGKDKKIALSCMTMTHPLHQGKGYFKTLALDLYTKLAEDGFIGVFGFANQNSHYGFRKNLGWIDLSPLNLFTVEKDNFKNFHRKNEYKFDFEDRKLNQISIRDFQKLNFSNQSIKPERSCKFLKWRLLENPTYNYFSLNLYENNVLIGALVYKFYNDSIDIMEVFNKIGFESEILVNGIEYLINKNVKHVNIWSNLHSEEHLLLEKSGFKEKHFLTYFGMIPLSTNPHLLKISDWHFRFIDSDVF